MQGTRVDSLEAVWDGEEGAYYPTLEPETGAVTALWFKLPRAGNHGRLAAKGYGGGNEPEWTITVEDDGTVTVDPSIEQHPVPGDPPIPYWHGYLEHGVWREV